MQPEDLELWKEKKKILVLMKKVKCLVSPWKDGGIVPGPVDHGCHQNTANLWHSTSVVMSLATLQLVETFGGLYPNTKGDIS